MNSINDNGNDNGNGNGNGNGTGNSIYRPHLNLFRNSTLIPCALCKAPSRPVAPLVANHK